MKTPLIILAAAFGLIVGANSAFSQKRYDVGASDTEIRIGNTMPYSGPLSAYALIGRTEEAYFRKLNSEGGMNGRKINFISYDDAFNPAKTVEQTRKLVESEEVLFLAGSLGTPTSNAVRAYLNQRKTPQLFLATGASTLAIQEIPVDYGLAAELPDRRSYLCEVPPQRISQQQNSCSLPE